MTACVGTALPCSNMAMALEGCSGIWQSMQLFLMDCAQFISQFTNSVMAFVIMAGKARCEKRPVYLFHFHVRCGS